SWNSRSGLQARSGGPAPREEWRALWPTVLSTWSAVVSDGRRSDTGPSRWDSPVPFPMSFENSPKRSFRTFDSRRCHRPRKAGDDSIGPRRTVLVGLGFYSYYPLSQISGVGQRHLSKTKYP